MHRLKKEKSNPSVSNQKDRFKGKSRGSRSFNTY